MKRASYRDAIAWIAENDNAGSTGYPPSTILDLEKILDSDVLTVVAMLFGITEDEVAAEVLLVRTKAKAEGLRKAREQAK